MIRLAFLAAGLALFIHLVLQLGPGAGLGMFGRIGCEWCVAGLGLPAMSLLVRRVSR